MRRMFLRLLAHGVKSAVVNGDFKKTECSQLEDAVSYEIVFLSNPTGTKMQFRGISNEMYCGGHEGDRGNEDRPTLKEAERSRWDLVSLGEVMLRLDPGDVRISTAREFRAWEGGGEYNVARGLRRCFGLRTAIVTVLADNPVGQTGGGSDAAGRRGLVTLALGSL